VVQVCSKSLGVSTLIGSGAGRYPTANSVVSDMLAIANGCQSALPFPRPPSSLPFEPLLSSRWYIRAQLTPALLDDFKAAVGPACEALSVTLQRMEQVIEETGPSVCCVVNTCSRTEAQALVQSAPFATVPCVLFPMRD